MAPVETVGPFLLSCPMSVDLITAQSENVTLRVRSVVPKTCHLSHKAPGHDPIRLWFDAHWEVSSCLQCLLFWSK